MAGEAQEALPASSMPITEEQRRAIERNRLAAQERKAERLRQLQLQNVGVVVGAGMGGVFLWSRANITPRLSPWRHTGAWGT